ncbi:MAG: alpha/beta hydrolase [Acidobacteria bacterium]|nr:alpha/beta hydrolase [Acidobacteriota bacterium]
MQTEAKRKSGWLRRWIKRFFVTLAALVLLLVVTGAIYQYVATVQDARKYPPPGKMVDVGGFKMHLNCIGEGSPTVVLDSGLFFGAFGWNYVTQEIAKFTRVCTFDRAGVGWSEASPNGRGINQINKELHDLLTNAGEQKPFIFAGHSIAGMYAQNYANIYADEVVGVVLIDSSHAEQIIRNADDPPPIMLARTAKIAAPVGIFRLVMGASSGDSLETQERKALQNSTKHLYATADEILAIEENSRILREKPMQLGDKPLIVLTRSLEIQPDDTERYVQATEHWKEMQKDLASRSTDSKHIIAEKAGHVIQRDEPELVVNAIRQVVEATRK